MNRKGLTDLHLHLDGSLSPKIVLKLARMCDVQLPAETEEELEKYLSVDIHCESLNDYLKCFDLPLLVLQKSEAMELAAYDLGKRLEEQGISYAEVRFAPQLHKQKKMSQKDAVEAVIRGFDKVMEDREIQLRVILCCMRGDKAEENVLKENLETIRLAKEYLGKGVVAVDLAGAEALFPTCDFAEEFALARKLGVPFTIHAGEAKGPESIWKALEFGASRIGHGTRAIEDENLMEELARRKIPLEMCPTSNLQTKAVKSIDEYPLREYLKRGMIVTVNTDNMTVSGTTIEKEYEFLKEQYALTREEEEKLIRYGKESVFV
ncbi:MAG: adenosine deaminase [Dorea sp.]